MNIVNGRRIRTPPSKDETISVPRSRPSQKDSIANREMMNVKTTFQKEEVPKKKNLFQSFFSNSNEKKQSSRRKVQTGKVGFDTEEQNNIPISRPSQRDSRSVETGPSFQQSSGTSPSNMGRRASQESGSTFGNIADFQRAGMSNTEIGQTRQQAGSTSTAASSRQASTQRGQATIGLGKSINGLGGGRKNTGETKMESMGKNKAKMIPKPQSRTNVAPMIRQKEASPATQWENRGENFEEIAIKQEMNGRYIKDPITRKVEKPPSSLSSWNSSNSAATKVSRSIENPFGPGYNDRPPKEKSSSKSTSSSGIKNGRQFLQNLSSRVAPKSNGQQQEMKKQPSSRVAPKSNRQQQEMKKQPQRAVKRQPARTAANIRDAAPSKPSYGPEVSDPQYEKASSSITFENILL